MRRSLAASLTGVAVIGALTVAASTAFTASTASSAAKPVTAPTLTVAIPGPFGGCDPGSASTTPATDAVLSLVLPSAFSSGLLSTPVGDTAVVSQAEVVSLNPQTVVYTIAPGARWPGGRPFTAQDLIRTWHSRHADAVVADLGYRDVLSATPSAAGTTLTVVFAAPYSDWESLFNLVVPAMTPHSGCTLPSASLDPSMGPYQITSATRASVTLAANPAWPGAAPFYSHVVFTTNPSLPVAPAGPPRLAYLPSPTLDQLQALTSTGGLEARLQHDTTVVSLDFAVRGPSSLPIPVREAVARLVDRAALVNALEAPIDNTTAPAVSHLFGQGDANYLGAPGSPVGHPVAPSPPLPGASGAAAYGELPDVAAADELLHAAGYAKAKDGWHRPGGEPFVMCLEIPRAVTLLGPTAGTLRRQLQAQGVGVALRAVESVGAVVADLRAGTCAAGIVSRTGDGFATHEAANWLAPSQPVPSDLTWTGVNDPIASAAAITATGMLNPVSAIATWTDMDARLWNLMVGMPLYSPSVYVGWSPQIAGLVETDTVGGFVYQIPSLLPAPSRT